MSVGVYAGEVLPPFSAGWETHRVSDWMVQVWEDGGWVDYWPVTVPGERREDAVQRAPAVFCGRYLERYQRKALRWRVGRQLR